MRRMDHRSLLWVALAFALIFTIGWLKVFLICLAMLVLWVCIAFFIMRAQAKAKGVVK